MIGKINPQIKQVHIYGAGISGLLVAYFLKKKNYHVTLFEKTSHIGGKIQTKTTSLGPVETAANAIMSSPAVLALLQELRLSPITPAPKLKRWVWLQGKARSPLNFLTILRMVLNLWRKTPSLEQQENISVADFFRPLTGKQFCEQTLSAALGGIYATQSSSLHFRSLFPKTKNQVTYFSFIKTLLKNKKNLKSLSFERGMQELVDALRSKLQDNIQLQQSPPINTNVNTIICTDAHEAGDLLANYFPQLSQQLKKINYVNLSTTTLFSKNTIPFLENAFGVLFPPSEKHNLLGTLHNTAIFSNRAKNLHSYTFITKGDFNLSLIPFEHQLDIISIHSTPWTRAIPVYDQTRYAVISTIQKEWEKNPNMPMLFGNYVAGISLRELVEQASLLTN
jgi:protoporphyrinogen oxidase